MLVMFLSLETHFYTNEAIDILLGINIVSVDIACRILGLLGSEIPFGFQVNTQC